MFVVALAGNPNSGKTTLFNQLTGLNQRVGNYPGVTVERRAGAATIAGKPAQIIDLPGTYSLISRSRDEAIAFEVLTGRTNDPKPNVVVLVIDASNLERNLYLALSVLEIGLPAVVALNMMDVAEASGLVVEPKKIEEVLGVEVVPIVAPSRRGLPELEAAVARTLAEPHAPKARSWQLGANAESVIGDIKEALIARGSPPASADGEAVWLLSSVGTSEKGRADEEHLILDGPLGEVAELAKKTLVNEPDFSAQVIAARYQRTREISAQSTQRSRPVERDLTDRLDNVLLHPLGGPLVFFAVMAVLFQSIFAWAEPLMGLIESGVGLVQEQVAVLLPEGALRDLLIDGAIGGAGNVIVFVPQIGILFAFLAILEDSGYLARAAFISDRLMARIGLHGRAFVPLLSGFACAIPAVMATRVIESRRDRLVTILVTPLVSCSARLPVYTLIIASLFASDERVLGVFSKGGLLMLSMYGLSILVTIGAAFVLKRTLLKSPTPPLVLELPPYRIPALSSVVRRVVERCVVFIRDAGTVIMLLSIVLWALLYFPREVELPPALLAQQAALSNETPEEQRTAVEAEVRAERLRQSIAGRIGHTIEPLIAPLGFDWKIGIGLLASFAAREVFVSTMGLVYGVGDAADEESAPLRERIQAERHPDTGLPVYTPLVGLALMVFFLLAAQCVSTVAIVRRETNSWRWPAFMVASMTVMAWVGAFVVYQGGRLLGFQ
ncbi:MAG: ferrous iron transport protein B [Deltaproteobacteria bacterium]|nr:ferrous iron transport protein B [Deltaproteobacteria bacterium]